MMRNVVGAAFLASAATAGFCSPYWIAWEDGWPEQQGWRRVWHYKEAKRWLEDGTLVIDSRESIEIWDYYMKDMNGKLDPEPGKEAFLLQWRGRVDESTVWGDPGVLVHSDDAWGGLFTLNTESIRSVGEPGKQANYAPGEYHEFEVRSFDMRHYELWVDGARAWDGAFAKVVRKSLVEWGDTGGGSASLARWDYFRFGVVVPEPSGAIMWTALAGLYLKRWLRRPARL